MRILSIDYGDSRTGVAVSGELGWMAQPVETIDMKKGNQHAVARLCTLLKEYESRILVYGFPLNMNGTVGPRGEKTLEFIELIRQSMPDIEFVKVDERLTSVIANKTLQELGIKTKNKKGLVDRIAAVQILQTYLDSEQNKKNKI